MTILEEARHSLIIIEHDPLLYEDAQGMVEYVSQGLHDAAKEAAVLLYSPGTDTFLEDLARNADRFSHGDWNYSNFFLTLTSRKANET